MKDSSRKTATLAYLAGILGAFLIVAFLVWAMRHYTQPAPLNAARAAERAKALVDLRAAEAEEMNNVAWIDKAKGVVRLRVEDAVKLTQQAWSRDPVAARSNLIERVQKATAAPPKPPEQPSAFE